MPWRECSVTEERLRLVARPLEGEGMSRISAFPARLATRSSIATGIRGSTRLPIARDHNGTTTMTIKRVLVSAVGIEPTTP